MTNVLPSRLGQINGAGDPYALFLKLFSGETLVEFERSTVFMDRHFVRSITTGRSAQFPYIGRATSFYHTPGNFIDGQAIPHAEKVITIDDLLVAPFFLASVDEAMNHYDVRSAYSTETGRALAQTFDLNVARMHVLAARAASPITGRAGGSRLTNASMATDAAVLEANFFASAQTLDEKFVGESDRSCFLRPAQFYLLAQRDRLVNNFLGAQGSVASGKVETVAGITLVKTNNVPGANDTANANIQAKYRANFGTTVGIVANKMAVGTLKLMDMSTENQYEVRTQGNFFVSKMLVGSDWLRPDCAIELATS